MVEMTLIIYFYYKIMMKEDVYPIFFEKDDPYTSVKNFTKYCMTTRKVAEFLIPPLRQRLYSIGII